MPKDIRITFTDELFEGDFIFNSSTQDFEYDEGLETAVMISLFTDRRANNDDELPDPSSTDKRGWWGDLANPYVEGDQIGSRLWLLERSKTLATVPQLAKQYAREALQWMVDDGVAVKIEVDSERQGTPGNDILALSVKIYKIDGTDITYKYELQWTAQSLRISNSI